MEKEMSIFNQQLAKFRRIQSILKELYVCSDIFSLNDSTCDMVYVGGYYIKNIPLKGDSVYFSLDEIKDDSETDVLMPLSCLSEQVIDDLLNIMRKAMIIEELKNM